MRVEDYLKSEGYLLGQAHLAEIAELRKMVAAADALAEDVRRFVHPRNIPDALAAYWAARRGE